MPQDSNIRIIIVGAGKAGELILKDIMKNKDSSFEVVGFVDDDSEKQGIKVMSKKVLGRISDLNKIIKEYGIHELFIAIPSERGRVIRKIIEKTEGLNVVYKILPRLSEVLMQDFSEDYLKFIRKVKVEDLLGGEILKSDQKDITKYTKGKVILITGAAGSIGSELSRLLMVQIK
jgi:FlaA1/EpsC-like NDP-sugar epimerase